MNSPDWFSRDIYFPANDAERESVRFAQRVMGVTITGEMDDETRRRIRGLQYTFGIPMTGILDRATAHKIDGLRNFHG
jgi:hypothetical protein